MSIVALFVVAVVFFVVGVFSHKAIVAKEAEVASSVAKAVEPTAAPAKKS